MDRFTPISSKRTVVKRVPKTARERFLAMLGLFWERHHRKVLVFLFLTILIGLPTAIFSGFKTAYYRHNPTFYISPKDVSIQGNSMLRREILEEYVQATIHRMDAVIVQPDGSKKICGFDLVTSDLVARLKRDMPSIKDVRMRYNSIDHKVELMITERQPIVSFETANHSRMVADLDGVVFRPVSHGSRGWSTMVLLGDHLNLEPGAQLPKAYNCILHLLDADRRAVERSRLPGGIKQVRFRGLAPEDGIYVYLYNGRRIMMQWAGMEYETAASPKMLELLADLNGVLASPDGRDFMEFSAVYGEKKQVSAKIPE